jgi:hypothetical protein
MIKAALFAFLSVISMASFSTPTAKEISACEASINEYGSGKGVSYIPSNCVKVFSSMAAPSARKSAGEWEIIGHSNILFVTHKKDSVESKNFIAGSSTQLKNIKALAIDGKNQELAVLLGTGEVHVFTLRVLGNISAIRKISHNSLIGATDLVVKPDTDEILIENPVNKKIFVFSRFANINGREGQKRLEVLRTLSLNP